MLALLGAVLVASVLGSVHCAGMCGAFLALAVGVEPGPGSRRMHARCQGAYHSGRLITYSTLGAIAGGLGAAFDLGGRTLGVERIAATLAGVVLVLYGVVSLLTRVGVSMPRLPVPRVLREALLRCHRAISMWHPVHRAFATGLLTTLLPCGWLYAFVVASAGTASPLVGAGLMAAFWVGTLPVMVSLGAGLSVLTGALRARLPVVTAVLMIGAGVFALLGRVTLPTSVLAARVGPVPGSAGEVLTRVSTARDVDPACCDPSMLPARLNREGPQERAP